MNLHKHLQKSIKTIQNHAANYHQSLLITLTLPLNHRQVTNLSTYIKSTILECLRNSSSLTQDSALHEKIVTAALSSLEEFQPHKNGLVLLGSIAANSSLQSNFKPSEVAVKFIHLQAPVEPDRYCFLGKTIDLHQVSKCFDPFKTALVVVMQRAQAQLLSFKDETIESLVSLDNRFITFKENEYIEPFTSANGQLTTFHGSGAETVARNQKKEDEWFVADIEKKLSTFLSSQEREHGNVLIMYSHRFTEFVSDLASKIQQKFPQLNIAAQQIMPDGNTRLAAVVKRQLDKMNKKSVEQLIDQLEDDQHQLRVESLEELVDANLEAAVEAVVVTDDLKKTEGYINDFNQVFISKPDKQKSYKVDNVWPYLLTSVINNGGAVIEVDNDSIALDSDDCFVAKRRFIAN